VLNGIGGRTIAEAQSRLSYAEYRLWRAYRARRGSLNVGMRVESAIALLATMYGNTHRAEGAPPFDLYDFAPHHDRPDLTLEEAMRQWG